ncbi:MAG: protein YgfX [Betaproteobacteria bacterium]
MRLQLRASLSLTLMTLGVHAAAAAVLWSLLPPPAAYAAVLVALLGIVAAADRTLFLRSSSAAYLELKGDDALRIVFRNGSGVEGQLAAKRYVSRWLVVLGLPRRHRLQRTILVARDMLAPAEFRLLRLWALWKSLPAKPSPARLARST